MAIFHYQALSKDGKTIEDNISANSRHDAILELQKLYLTPIELHEIKKTTEKKKSTFKNRNYENKQTKLKTNELILFTEELSDMLDAGLQLEPALKSMEGRLQTGNIKIISQRLRSSLRDGVPFSQSLKQTSTSFSALYCSLAAAGEASGSLGAILKRQSNYLKTISDLKNKMILALIYPSFLIATSIIVSLLFTTFLVPQLAQLITQYPGSKIPLALIVLMSLSGFIQSYWYLIIISLVVCIITFKVWVKNKANQLKWQAFQLNIPLIGPTLSSKFYVQFLETMANLIDNGLPLIKAIELSKDTTQNEIYKKKLNDVISRVEDGRSLSSALKDSQSFPPLMVDFISVGEQTGNLSQSLERAAVRYDKELNQKIMRIMAVIKPFILFMMAGLVGTMAYVMLTSIYKMMSHIK
jgi:general secretion pathway protein F